MKTLTNNRNGKRLSYLEAKRQLVLEWGYRYVRFRSRAKKSLTTLKRQLHLFYL